MQLPQHLVSLVVAVTLTIVSLILYVIDQQDSNSPIYKSDRRVLYTYAPRSIDLTQIAALLPLTWLDTDSTGTKSSNIGFKCNTPSVFGTPTVRFDPAITGLAACPILLQAAPLQGSFVAIQIASLVGATSALCPNNSSGGYKILINGDGVEQDSGVVAIVNMAANPPVTFSPSSGACNVAFELNNQRCTPYRAALIGAIQTATNCSTEGSQFCSCVQRFTSYLSNNSYQNALHVPASTEPVTKLSDVLAKGLQRCSDLRRHNDVRTKLNDQGFKLSYTLILFSITLLCNAINAFFLRNNYFQLNETQSGPTILLAALLLVHLLCGILLPLAGGSNGTVEMTLFAAIEIPAAFLGLYLEFPDWLGWGVHKSHDPLLLHPAFFNVALQSLTLFTLLARGVVQYEIIVFEVVKAHAVSFLYAVIAWYNMHAKDNEATAGKKEEPNKVFDSVYVQEAYLILFWVAAAASIDTSFLIPYPSDAPFRPFWLLPAAFVVLNLINRVWVSTLKLRSIATISQHDYFNDITSVLLFALWLSFLGWFMERHLRLYNSVPANDTPWPSVANLGLNGFVPTTIPQ